MIMILQLPLNSTKSFPNIFQIFTEDFGRHFKEFWWTNSYAVGTHIFQNNSILILQISLIILSTLILLIMWELTEDTELRQWTVCDTEPSPQLKAAAKKAVKRVLVTLERERERVVAGDRRGSSYQEMDVNISSFPAASQTSIQVSQRHQADSWHSKL